MKISYFLWGFNNDRLLIKRLLLEEYGTEKDCI